VLALASLPLAGVLAGLGAPVSARSSQPRQSLRAMMLTYDPSQATARALAHRVPAACPRVATFDMASIMSDSVTAHLKAGGLVIGITGPATLFCAEQWFARTRAKLLWREPVERAEESAQQLAALLIRSEALTPIGFLHPSLMSSANRDATFLWAIGRTDLRKVAA
jgi:hypothetical protein